MLTASTALPSGAGGRWRHTAFARRAEVSDRDSILATLASLDVADYLRSAGLHERDLRAVRERLL